MGSLRVVFPKPERWNPFRVIDLDQSGELADRIMRLGMLQVMKLSVGPGLAGRAGPQVSSLKFALSLRLGDALPLSVRP
jgi:hypothetical protein